MGGWRLLRCGISRFDRSFSLELAMSNQSFISVGPYWDIIHRHRAAFLSTVVVGLALTALAVILIPKQYTSSVLLEVWHADIQPALVGAEATSVSSTSTHIE